MYFVANGYAPPSGWLDTLHSAVEPRIATVPTEPVITSPIVVHDISTVETDTTLMQELKEAEEELINVFRSTIKRHSNKSPMEYMAALKAAKDTLSNISTSNAAVSMLNTLGKYSERGGPRHKRLGNMPVQTTALARRRKCLRGRAVGEAGRPRKNTVLLSNLHSYSMPSRRLGKEALHNLGTCVKQNISLGKTHGRK